ncbi:MAG: WbqC family protein [Pirellulaceae bacterium]
MTTPGAARKTVGIIQSNYIPWKGYFDFIAAVDEFILLDTVQYTRRDWRNRNRIKTSNGGQWLTIPVEVKGKFDQRICDTRIADDAWNTRHWETIRRNYCRAPRFAEFGPWLESCYRSLDSSWLSEVNAALLREICRALEIDTPITRDSDYVCRADAIKSQRLLSLCTQVGATHYISGPAAECYLDVPAFHQEGIEVSFFEYEGFEPYEQLFPPFNHYVSIVDVLLNAGRDASRYVVRENRRTANDGASASNSQSEGLTPAAPLAGTRESSPGSRDAA